MEDQRVKTCFTITFTDEQYNRAKNYVSDMKRHPNRVFWIGKEGKSEDELVIEQIAHRILSGFIMMIRSMPASTSLRWIA